MSGSWNVAVAEFCRAACSGAIADAEKILQNNPELAERSIHCAAVLGLDEVVGALLKGDPPLATATMGRGWNPLLLLACSYYGRGEAARTNGVVRSARLLLAYGADPEASLSEPDLPGRRLTPLSCAAGMIGNRELCRVLLEAGADANDGASLFLAIAKERWECVELIVQHGGDWDSTDAEGRYAPLHWLLDLRFVRTAVERMLREGANPNVRVGAHQETALHIAVRRRRVEMLEALVRAGSHINAQTAGGMTAYRHALRRHFTDVTTKLEALGADTSTTPSDELAVALQRQDLEHAREMIQNDPTLVTECGPEEARILPDLAAAGKLESMRLLLDAGIDIASPGLDGGTALHQTAWFGMPHCARLLIERGAPLAIRDDVHDSTPLGWAAHGSRYSGGAAERAAFYTEVVELLLEAGAPLPRRDESHDREQFADASAAVVSVLQRFGWNAPQQP